MSSNHLHGHDRCNRFCVCRLEGRLQRMRLTEQEAEREAMRTAFAMSDSVLRDDESDREYERYLQQQERTQRQIELDRELAIALANFDNWEPEDLPDYIVLPGLFENSWLVFDTFLMIQGDSRNLDRSHVFSRNPGAELRQTAPNINMEVITANHYPRHGRLQHYGLHGHQSAVVMSDFSTDSPYFGLHPMYFNYRYVPVKFSEQYQWPPGAVQTQLEELNIDRGNEDIVEWREGMSENDRCLICLTNVATRIAVPCGHKQSCRSCISRVITTTRSDEEYLQVTPDGQYIPTYYDIPVRCILCRCILGMIVVCH